MERPSTHGLGDIVGKRRSCCFRCAIYGKKSRGRRLEEAARKLIDARTMT